ncbi:MAG: C1 family peptidase, partial [Bacilli bacterium]|nr:C1 family peptidase [Bacilli bacterium]
MNKFILIATIALVACLDDEVAFQSFQRFVAKFGKRYASMEEYLARFQVFKLNLQTVLADDSKKTYKTGITKFSDLTYQEFAKTYLNLNFNAFALVNMSPAHATARNDDAPEYFDWREKGRVSAVKDQASCGSCWAFSTVGNLEGLYYAAKGVMKTFSEQLLVDCDTEDSGCNGGLMELTFDWLKSNGGFMTDADYPYTGYKGSCKQDKSKFVDMKVTGYVKLGDSSSTWSPVDEVEVRDFLLETGPLAIALNANPLQTYTGGILDLNSSRCSPSGMNHAVTLVGYGYDKATNLDYWIVKNSWGKSWGEDGYFRISRGKGTCGINQYIT